MDEILGTLSSAQKVLSSNSHVKIFSSTFSLITSLPAFLPLRTEGNRKVPYHYYEAGSRDECAEYHLHESAPYGGHRFITEKSVFAKWAKTHSIKFFNPPWQLSWPQLSLSRRTFTSERLSSASRDQTNQHISFKLRFHSISVMLFHFSYGK